MPIDLKGPQAKAFTQALVSAFSDYDDLAMMVRFGLNEKLATIARPDPLDKVAFALISWAEARNRLDELLRAALKENPTNEALKQFAYEVFLTSEAEPAQDLEAIVMPTVGFQNVVSWRARMEQAERCVCRVELEMSPGDWRGIATGFLVGPDLILTNQHVAREIQGAGRVKFDYVVDSTGAETQGRVCSLAPSWRLSESPVAELDYALIKLAEPAGEDVVDAATGRKRGWLKPKQHRFNTGEPLFILQHPTADPLQLGVGSVSQIRPTPPRIIYSTNTLRGSSGSPCFTLGWELAALHHAGPASGNAGIPMEAILPKLGQFLPAAGGA